MHSDSDPSDGAAGYRMPAEWEPHAATWIGWPHNESDWPGKLPAVKWAYGEIVRHLAPGETVRILVDSPEHEEDARWRLNRVGVDPSRVEFFRVPSNRGWTRDFGPIFVRRDESANDDARRAGGVNPSMAPSGDSRPPLADLSPPLAIARFGFNAWAKYPDWQLDAQVAGVIAEQLGVPAFPVQHGGRDVVLEGGAIDVNGTGTLLTTEECLLDQQVQPRNPGLSRTEMEGVLKSALGVRNVIWLGRGIVGDDTHGHVDDLCRFANRNTVVLAQEPDRDDPNHHILEENRERLEDARLEDGSKLSIARLPMPHPLFFDGIRLPASYANFYIANAAVLVPTFNDPRDRDALGILAELFTDRPVIGIHAVDLVWGLGTLHCLTQQEPIGSGKRV